MRIKRFFAPDIRKAMKMVKEELGPDAVIMSNRSVDGGVEIVAARDFDEQAIHRNINRLEQADPSAASKTEIAPQAQATEPAVHVVSSKRKPGFDKTTSTHTRSRDQYIGYAEKIHLAENVRITQRDSATPRPATPARSSSKDSNDSHSSASKILGSSLVPLMQEMRCELQKELDSIKSMLNNTLIEPRLSSGAAEDSVRGELRQRLTDIGVTEPLLGKLVKRLGSHQNAQKAFDQALRMLEEILPMDGGGLLEDGGVVALVGPTGVGKTTTLAKIAAQFILRHGRQHVGLLSMDNFRIAGQEQLKIYGRILNVPVRIAKDTQELSEHLSGFSDKRLVLIDTAGMGQRDKRLAAQIDYLAGEALAVKPYLVLSAATQPTAIKEAIAAFQGYHPQAAILTKLDETAVLGGALSAVIERQLPLAFVTDGQQVPEDIHIADAEDLVAQCVARIAMENGYTKDEIYQDWIVKAHA